MGALMMVGGHFCCCRSVVVLLALATFMLQGCSARPQQMTVAELEQLLEPTGEAVRIVSDGLFPLLTVSDQEALPTSPVLRVYIEGDGLSWRTRRQLSAHPTPIDPVALRLMQADPVADKLYVARPCQFVQSAACESRYWSTDRFAAEVVEAVSLVLETLKKDYGYQQLELVGYSGGATVALLLAAQRSDVVSVITVAGNLDIEAFCRLHRVSALTGSLNPVDFVDQLQTVPQLHFIGGDDLVIPYTVFASYRDCFVDNRQLVDHVVAGVDHHHGWVERWPQLVRQSP